MRLTPVQGSILFFVLAPGTVAGLIPWAISGWTFSTPFLGSDATRFLGAALILAALDIILDSFARFALIGQGTPAPTHPTRHLVVSGFYRHVRNPMYVAVLGAIGGQALLFADARLLGQQGHVDRRQYEKKNDFENLHGSNYSVGRKPLPLSVKSSTTLSQSHITGFSRYDQTVSIIFFI